MSDTPETDAALYPMNQVDIVWPEFARELERERDELRRMSVTEMMGHNLNVKHHVTEWENRCLKAERERDEARFLLKQSQSALDAIHLEVGCWIKTMKEHTD
jgi:hypothetical protein